MEMLAIAFPTRLYSNIHWHNYYSVTEELKYWNAKIRKLKLRTNSTMKKKIEYAATIKYNTILYRINKR